MLSFALIFLCVFSNPAVTPSVNVTNLKALPRAEKCNAVAVSIFKTSAEWAVIAANRLLPTVIAASHFDPLVDVVHNIKIPVPHKYGCDEVCWAEGFATCKDYWLQVSTVDLFGLNTTKIAPLTLNTCEELAQTEDCDCGSTGPRAKAFRASVTASAELLHLNAKVNMKINGGGLHAECKNVFRHWTNNLWSGHASCTLKRARVTIRLAPCGALCSVSTVALTCLTALDVRITENDFSCDADDESKLPYLRQIIQYALPRVEHNLVSKLGPAIKETLNNYAIEEIMKKLKVPRSCQSREVEIVV